MNGNNCSIKGCCHKAFWAFIHEQREYRICPKHKFLIVNPLQWERI